MSEIDRDPDYDYIPPLADPPPMKKGKQCGGCGRKFDHGVAYGLVCPNSRCPMGFNSGYGRWS